MRIAKLVVVRDGRLVIPAEFHKMLGMYEGSQLHTLTIPLSTESPRQVIITAIPPACWDSILRIAVLMSDNPGALSRTAEILATDLGANILLMEGYGRRPEREGWWSAVIDFPAIGKDPDRATKLAIQDKKVRKRFEAELEREVESGIPVVFPKRLAKAVKDAADGADSADNSAVADAAEVAVEPGAAEDAADADADAFRLRRSEEKPLVVYPLRLTKIGEENADQMENAVTDFLDNGSIAVGPSSVGEDTYRGLVMCNTEEKFLRLVEIREPAQMMIEVSAKAPDFENVGIGTLHRLSRLLVEHPVGKENAKYGVNIVYTCNYLTRREKDGGCREVSIIDFILQTPSDWRGLDREPLSREWNELFTKLVRDPAVVGERSWLTVFGKREMGFVVRNGEVVEIGFWSRLRARSLRQALPVIVCLLLLALLGLQALLTNSWLVFTGGVLTAVLGVVLNWVAKSFRSPTG